MIMASISGILGAKRPALNQKIPYVTQSIHYSQFVNSSMQFYDCSPDVIERTADNIEMAGEIQAPIIVRKMDVDRYEIISGHKRVAAAKVLVEERGLKKFTFIPTRIIDADDQMAEYLLISTNDYPEKSDYERMIEVVRLYEIIPKLEARQKGNSENSPEKSAITARMLRRLVARETSMCATRVGNFKNIYTHFTPIAMEAFKNKQFGINVAIKLASLSGKEQDMLIKAGNLSISSVNDYIGRKKAKETEETSHTELTYQEKSCTPDMNAGWNDNTENTEKQIPSAREAEKQPYYTDANNTIKLHTERKVENNETVKHIEEIGDSHDDLLQTALNLKKKSEKIIGSDADDHIKLEAKIITEALTLWINQYQLPVP